MSVCVSANEVDWDRFVARWREWQTPEEALDGSAHVSFRDEYVSSHMSAADMLEGDGGGARAGADSLRRLCVLATGDYSEPVDDLGDPEARGPGGFEHVFAPASVKEWAAGLATPSPEDVSARLAADGASAGEVAHIRELHDQWLRIMAGAASRGRGLVLRIA